MVCLLSFAQKKIMVVVDDTASTASFYAEDKQIVDSLNAWGFSPTMIPVADIKADKENYDFSGYDGAFVTESGGSSSANTFGVKGVKTLPTICHKAYAIRYSRTDWPWINQDKDGVFDLALMDSTKVTEGSECEVLVEHDILCGYNKGDKFSLCTKALSSGAHIQTFDFDNVDAAVSPDADIIAKNATALLESVWAAEGPNKDGYANATNIMYAIEETTASKRTVVLGTHTQYLGEGATEDFWAITKNSMLWVLGEEITCGTAISKNITSLNAQIFPNPASGLATVTFNRNISSNVILSNLTGQKVAEFKPQGNKAFIETNKFAAGVYFVTVENETIKLIIK